MKQFAVIGLGRFGTSVAQELCRLGHEVLAVDDSIDKIIAIADTVTHAVQCNATDPEALNLLGLRNFDCVIVSIGSDMQTSILVTMLCKELGVSNVVVKSQSELHSKILKKLGADKIVFPERDMAERTAQSLVSDSILDYIELSPDFSLIEINAPKSWQGFSLNDLKLPARYSINVMAIKHSDGSIIVTPRANDMIEPGDTLIVIGANDDLDRVGNLK